MSIKTHYSGGLGNNIFQYFASYFLAMENGMRLNTPWEKNHIIPIIQNYDISARDGVVGFKHIGDEHDVLSKKWEKANYRLNGVFQVWQWYFDRRDQIKKLIQLPAVKKTNNDDIVSHIRLGDYIPCRAAMDIDWYVNVFRNTKFSRLYIVTDDPKNTLLNRLSEFKPRIINDGILKDFMFIRNAKRLVMSNSTFCWWAAFLGEPESVTYFQRWIGNPVAKLTHFPGATHLDGKFLHELT